MGKTQDAFDADTQIAILASLLEPASFPLGELKTALNDARGDVAAAAERLLLPRVQSSGKRKAGSSLESWLGKTRGASGAKRVVGEIIEDEGEDNGGPSKPLRNAFTLLQPPSPVKAKAAPQPAIRLASQAAIDTHKLPLTLLTSPLSPKLASALFHAMMDESESWERNRWFLAGRWVESPHTSANFYREGGGYGGQGRYYYSGNELDPPKPYPALLREAAEQIENVVNTSLEAHPRHPLEWAGKWRANVCGSNRYDGAASGVGWHADQLSYLGPGATIASFSLGATRAFRVRQTESQDGKSAPIRTHEVELAHNSLILMNAGCQERFKHTIPPQRALDLFRPGWDAHQEAIPPAEQKAYTSRINITFRFYRDDFHPSPSVGLGAREGTPVCKCGIPTLLRADQKAKARARMAPAPSSRPREAPVPPRDGLDVSAVRVREDDMVYFWQCQSPGNSGEIKGCGFFRILDMRAEGRGPCFVDVV